MRKDRSFGWVGNTQAKEMALYGRKFSPMVAIPVNPPRLLPPPVVDLEVLERLAGHTVGLAVGGVSR